MKHKHADVMTIWLQDMSTKIQFRNAFSIGWEDCFSEEGPSWRNDTEYRIKPQPVEMWQFAYKIKNHIYTNCTIYHYESSEAFAAQSEDPVEFEWIQKLDYTKIVREE